MRDPARYRAYQRWHGMVRRCTNPTHRDYRLYGGRGISVCQRWMDSFEDYWSDVGDPPAPGLTVDRIDNDGDYEPGNVRWATAREQALNRRYLRALRTHCPQGHAYDDNNTYRYPNGNRHCRACGRMACARYYRQKKAASL